MSVEVRKSFAKVKQNGHVVKVEFSGRPVDDGDCLRYLGKIKAIYDKKKPFVILFDASDCGRLTIPELKLQSEFMREHEKSTRKYMKRAAIVVSSTWMWGSLKILFALRKPATTLEVFADKAQAEEFLKAAFKKRKKS